MTVLTDMQIQYGFNYYHSNEPQHGSVTEVSQYRGETALTIFCTQLGDSATPQYKTQKEKKRVLQEWCDFLHNNTTAFEKLTFCSRMPQALFDAVCCQERLKKLSVKWGVYTDISRLANLQNLQLLHIGSGAGVESIEPIALLPNLIALSVENFQKIHDYSEFAQLHKLESLSITGDGLSPRYIHVDSLEFLRKMPQLRFLRFLTARLKSKDMTPILDLENIEHLTLASNKATKAIYQQLIALPKLKYGLLAEKPEMYN